MDMKSQKGGSKVWCQKIAAGSTMVDGGESLVEVGTMAHQYHQQKVCKERMGNWALKHVSRNNSTCMTHR